MCEPLFNELCIALFYLLYIIRKIILKLANLYWFASHRCRLRKRTRYARVAFWRGEGRGDRMDSFLLKVVIEGKKTYDLVEGSVISTTLLRNTHCTQSDRMDIVDRRRQLILTTIIDTYIGSFCMGWVHLVPKICTSNCTRIWHITIWFWFGEF